ncbi:hypothetical protein ABZ820_12645 [Streptomyces diacarni]|uniref:hypothetical protein n=1 Tax=Streptomyces diacarni TaxID=2800381 RepID=UPI0033EF638C
MSAESITAAVKEQANRVIAHERTARLRLAEAATNTDVELTSSDYANAMEAAAKAAPWKDLLAVAEKKGMRDALASVRSRATKHLIQYGETQSTSVVTNEIERCKREGLRTFLSNTEGMPDFFDGADTKKASDSTPRPACTCGGCASCMS